LMIKQLLDVDFDTRTIGPLRGCLKRVDRRILLR
jgi:hypothetical protein